MDTILEAQARSTFGKNEARRTRRAGQVPAVLYGGDGKATPIVVHPKALLKILHSESGQNTLIALKLAGAGDTRVLVKDFQVDPITHEVLHADFYRAAMDKVLHVTIPIVVHGEPKGVKQQGGVLEHIRREIEIECLPGDIPEHIDVDVSELMLVHVIMPKAEEVAAPADAAAVATATPAEPEVIKKGKKEEEEGEKVEKKEEKKK